MVQILIPEIRRSILDRTNNPIVHSVLLENYPEYNTMCLLLNSCTQIHVVVLVINKVLFQCF